MKVSTPIIGSLVGMMLLVMVGCSSDSDENGGASGGTSSGGAGASSGTGGDPTGSGGTGGVGTGANDGSGGDGGDDGTGGEGGASDCRSFGCSDAGEVCQECQGVAGPLWLCLPPDVAC